MEWEGGWYYDFEENRYLEEYQIRDYGHTGVSRELRARVVNGEVQEVLQCKRNAEKVQCKVFISGRNKRER